MKSRGDLQHWKNGAVPFERFFAKPYDTRVEMIRELRSEITPEIAIQEINRYADSEARYAEAAEEREFDERIRQIELEARARKAAAEREY